MKHWFAPSLVRRVVLALLLAFGIVFVVLLAVQVVGEGNPARVDPLLQAYATELAGQLDAFDKPELAQAASAVLARQNESTYRRAGLPIVLLLRVWDRGGAALYASPRSTHLSWTGPPGSTILDMDGERFHVFRIEGARWRVLLAQNELPRWRVLRAYAGELSVDLLIAFPCALLPLWLAVSQGLRPLRQLSRRIEARNPDDLAPTGLTPRHAELVPLARALDDLLARLRRKVDREHAFVHDAAHEMRTPMAVISAQAHALSRLEGDARRRREAEAHLDDAIARAANLMEQLLQLARLDDGATPPRRPADVALFARHELAALAPRAIAAGLELELEAPDTLVHAIDEPAVRSILHNLVGNAILYVPRGGHVLVRLETLRGALVLSVIDDGPGIPAAEREKLFERFVRGAHPEMSGSGLGLAIVRRAAERQGGRAWLEAGPGGLSPGRDPGAGPGRRGPGCQFRVSLPAG